jgi:hypothetical protein
MLFVLLSESGQEGGGGEIIPTIYKEYRWEYRGKIIARGELIVHTMD